jgi:predicted nucleic acid-binding protein
MIAVGRPDDHAVTSAELSELLEDMKFFGAPPEEIAQARHDYLARVVSGAYDVLPSNANAARLFVCLQTQWRMIGISTMSAARIIRTGLDYSVIAPTAAAYGIELGEGDMVRIAIMENSALNAWAEEAGK